MPEGKNERPEGTLADIEVLEEMLRIAGKSSPYSPYLDNIHGHQELAEVEKVPRLGQGDGEVRALGL